MSRCGAFGLLATAALLIPARTPAQESVRAEPQEIFLDLRYEVALRTVVTGRVAGDTLYLPVGELLEHLQVDRTLFPARTSVAGFYLTPDQRYVIRGDSGFVRLGSAKTLLAAGDLISTELEVYARPTVLEKLFGWSFIIDYQQLAIRLHSETALPVLEAYRRERRREALAAAGAEAAPDLRFPRQRQWLHGGVVQYGLSGIIAQNDGAMLDLAGGVEILGGDLQMNVHAALDSSRMTIPETGGFWRYVIDGRSWLTQFVAGEMLFNGAQLHDLTGLRVTNSPVQPRRLFGRDSIRGSTEPGWEVELYLNDRLAGYTRADQRGRYSFPLQLAYGSTVAELRHYGPTGEVQVEERRLQLPYALLPRGRTEYDIAGGRRSAGGIAGVARVAHGLNQWLTLGAGLESVADAKTITGIQQSTVPLLEGAVRFGPAIIEGDVVPGKSAGTAAELYFGSNTNLGFSWTRLWPDPIYNAAALREVGEAHAFLPFDIGAFP
ncbi:MAG TPA: hypothetical protein VK864_21025, partial [Longimicrobiales bacterium]|nr:hypothetical protein [Longimicrobiales bacterium]